MTAKLYSRTSVTASYSRQGGDTSSSGNPPPTSEKIVTTQVRGRSGEVIVLSGRIQNDENSAGTRTPLLSAIPLLGWLFKAEDKTEENDELTIYLIPRICENAGENVAISGRSSVDSMKEQLKVEIQKVVIRRRERNARNQK